MVGSKENISGILRREIIFKNSNNHLKVAEKKSLLESLKAFLIKSLFL